MIFFSLSLYHMNGEKNNPFFLGENRKKKTSDEVEDLNVKRRVVYEFLKHHA